MARGDKFDLHHNWGLRSIDINEDALASFRFELRSLRGRLHDGTLVDLAEDANKLFLDLKAAILERNEGNVTVYLAVPVLNLGRANVSHNGKDAVYLSVWPLPGANEISVAHALRAELAAIQTVLPPGTEIAMSYDGATYIVNALKEIAGTFTETVAIVAVIVFLSLGSARSALVSLVTASGGGAAGTDAGPPAFQGVRLQLGGVRLHGALPEPGSAGDKETRFDIAPAVAPLLSSAAAGTLVPVSLSLVSSEPARVTVYPPEIEFDP